jgi:hypothetical protein
MEFPNPEERRAANVGLNSRHRGLSPARARPNLRAMRTDTCPAVAVYTRPCVGDERNHDGRSTLHGCSLAPAAARVGEIVGDLEWLSLL